MTLLTGGRTRLMIGALWCIAATATAELKWAQLPGLPVPLGVAAPFAGVAGDALVVAGGANFPSGFPWEGGRKVWHDTVFLLAPEADAWRIAGKLPRRLAYGVSVTTQEGIVCAGGSDAERHYADVFLLSVVEGQAKVRPLPSLPRPMANGCGALLGDTLYLAGGTETPDATNALPAFWALDLAAAPSQWRELESWPGPARMLAVAAVQGGAFYLASGAALSGDSQGRPVRRYLNDAYRFTPGTGWRRVADLPRPAVAAPSPAPALGQAHFLVLGGDDGSNVGFEPLAQHPGFPNTTLVYHTITDTWAPFGVLPASRVTVPIVGWRGQFVMPSGEMRPGVRSPEVWACRAAGVPPSSASLEQVTVFTSGQEGYHTFRIPSVIVTPGGDLLAFAEGRKHTRSDAGDIDLVLKRSTDGGRTWSGLITVWDDRTNTCGNPCPVVDRATGTIWLLLTWNRGDDAEPRIIAQTSRDTRRVFVTSSTDDGRTWANPREITATAKLTNWTWYATGPGAGIQIERGLHRGRLVIPCDHIEAGTKRYYSHVLFSDDHGKTWQLGGSSPRDQVNECEVVELTGNRLLLNMRNYNRSKQTRQIAISHDGGRSWTDQRHAAELIEPICQASIRRYAWPTSGQKNFTLFSNPASTRRENMTIRLSADDAQTWPIARQLHAGPAAYSCLTVLPDKTIGCLYERGGKGPYETMTFARFALEWLVQGTGEQH